MGKRVKCKHIQGRNEEEEEEEAGELRPDISQNNWKRVRRRGGREDTRQSN